MAPEMLQHTVSVAEMSQGLAAGAPAQASPFDDIAAIHAMYEPRVFRFLLFSLRDRDAALSLTQDTFLNAWRARSDFRGDCAISTWLMRIAVNLLRSHTRTETFKFWKQASATAVDATELQHQLVHHAASAESALAAKQELAEVWAAVEKLAPRQRSIFLLRFVEEMELSEIAAATGLALPSVKSHLYRALDHVRAAAKQGAAKQGAAKQGVTDRDTTAAKKGSL